LVNRRAAQVQFKNLIDCAEHAHKQVLVELCFGDEVVVRGELREAIPHLVQSPDPTQESAPEGLLRLYARLGVVPRLVGLQNYFILALKECHPVQHQGWLDLCSNHVPQRVLQF
jgi:hypothetical protein